MPHDLRGNPLAVGDEVLIPAVVKSISEGENDCNCSVETSYGMPPCDEANPRKSQYTLNTKQVIKSSASAGMMLLLALVLWAFPGPAFATDTAKGLPARVETNQYLPPAPTLLPSGALAPCSELEVNTTASAALPGEPVKKAAKAGRRVLGWLFRGRARRACG